MQSVRWSGQNLLCFFRITTSAIDPFCFSITGDSKADLRQHLAAALSAQQVQDEVAEIAVAASEWIGQHAPSGQEPSNDLSSSDYKGLCRLCLVPIDLVQMPTLQLQPDVHCLVSVMVTKTLCRQGLWLCVSPSIIKLGLCMSCLPNIDFAPYSWS